MIARITITQSTCATLEGTTRYRERFKERAAKNHLREQQHLWLSSIGTGTYLGNADDETDDKLPAKGIVGHTSGDPFHRIIALRRTASLSDQR